MRRLFPAVVLLGMFVELCGTAVAQITLVPASSFLTPRRPEFIAAADFNRDQLEDAVAINPGSDKVTVLFGSAAGTFGTVLDLDIGQRLEEIATGDLNEDGIPDIAVVTNFGNSVFVADSVGNGTFNRPRGPFQVGKRPVAIAVGNFDNRNGLDLVTADQNIDRVTVLRNRGRNLGFESVGDFPVGNRPKGVAVGDFNGDGFDDIVAMNTGQGDADDVSVLLNTGNGSFRFPATFVVGAKAKSIAVADVNNDGAPDILCLNGGVTARINTFTVSVLVNQTTTVAGKVVGTGFFSTFAPVQVTCPTTIAGIPIFCSPNVIAPGDFDADGRVDFALSFQTLPQLGGSTPTAGLITAFAGNGDGSFDFATQVSVGLRPVGITAADFNGDTIPDLAVAEQGDRTVRLVLSLPPLKRLPGEACSVNRQCLDPSGNEQLAGFCVDGVCCNSAMCPAGQFCNVPPPGVPGTCGPPLDNGGRCTRDQQCASQFCVDGFCCGNRACPPGEFCNSGECALPGPNGTPCNNDGQQCASGFCVDGFCCSDSRCPVNQRCDIDGSEGICRGPGGPGTQCTTPVQCNPAFCVDGSCCTQETCGPGQSCNVPGRAGFCSTAPTSTPTPIASSTPVPTATPTDTPRPQINGSPCGSGQQCISTFCVNGVCCGSNSCPGGQSCNIFGSGGQCAAPGGVGQECRADTDCASGNCQAGTPPRCGAANTPTPTASPTPLPNGIACGNDSVCASGFCEDSICCARRCSSGEFCDVEGRLGQCSLPKPGSGDQCNPSDSAPCESGLFCQPDGVCCDTEDCPSGERCDIFGSEGTCAPPVGEGEECSKNIDCGGGLECRFDPFSQTNLCLPPRTPTPTLIPPSTPTRPAGVVVSQSSGGGCSIGGEGGAGSAWMLAGLPLVFLWMRRNALTVARQRRQ